MTEKNIQEPMGFWAALKAFFTGQSGEQSLEESVKEAIAEHEEETKSASLGAGAKEMLFNVLQYGELRVDDVMVPRADIVALDMDISFPELVQCFAKAAHSRIPLFRGSLDDVLGMVHVKDVLRVMASLEEGETVDDVAIMNIQRPVLFVPASMRVIDLLAKMRAMRSHMAIVVDEYGGTDGIVTIEDLVEEIVGEIEDEHDEDQSTQIRFLEGGNYLVDARFDLEELQEELQLDFLDEEILEDVETLGGLVFDMVGRVPEIGEMLPHDSGLVFEVVDADPRRISKVRIHMPTNKLTTISEPIEAKKSTLKPKEKIEMPKEVAVDE